MKQLLSKLYAYIKQLFSSETFNSVKGWFSSGTFKSVKEWLSSNIWPRVKQLFSSRLSKLLVLAFFLILVLVIVLSKCTADPEPPVEPVTVRVSVEALDVHKKPDARSRVLSQLPMDLEVEILEEKEVNETVWGRVDQMELPDGKKSKAGWIDLQFVSFGDEPDVETVVPEIEPEIIPVIADMGTVTAGKLNVRKGPDSKYETNGAYFNGDRIEILETQTVDDTVWGRTNLGWVGMGYVRMDGPTAFEGAEGADPNALKITSDGNTAVLGYGVVNLGELNVRLGPDTEYDKVRTIAGGVRYAYYQLADGWARMEDGWVSTEHFYIEGTTTDKAMSGTVTTNDLNIRSGPDTSFRSVGTYKQGETIEVLAQVDRWGYTEKGWVFMAYVEPVKPTYSTGSGTVNNGLNIRLEPNADAEIVGTYTTGDRVTIVEVIEGWGKTDIGWINLKYITYD